MLFRRPSNLFEQKNESPFFDISPLTLALYKEFWYLRWRDFEISSVQSLSRVPLFTTPWIAARQASLSITNSRSSLKLVSIESVMPSSHLILCRPPSPSAPNSSQHQGLSQWVNSSHEVAKVLEFQLQHQFFQWTFWDICTQNNSGILPT